MSRSTAAARGFAPPLLLSLAAAAWSLLPAACSSAPEHASEPAAAVLSASGVAEEPWSFHGRPGRVIRTTWYRVFTTDTDPAVADRLPLFLEQALEHYTTALCPLPHPPLKLDTFLMATRDEWSSLTRQFMGDQAGRFLAIPRGGFAAGGRALLWNIGPRDTLAIAAHEGWHQYTQRTFKEGLPIWLEEGIACYMEGHIPDRDDPSRVEFSPWANSERYWQLRTARYRGRLIPLRELLETSPQDLIEGSPERTLTYYAQVWALVHFLRDGQDGRRREALARLIADAAAGRLREQVENRLDIKLDGRDDLRRGSKVFEAYFTNDLDAAQAEYEEYIRRLGRGRGRRSR